MGATQTVVNETRPAFPETVRQGGVSTRQLHLWLGMSLGAGSSPALAPRQTLVNFSVPSVRPHVFSTSAAPLAFDDARMHLCE